MDELIKTKTLWKAYAKPRIRKLILKYSFKKCSIGATLHGQAMVFSKLLNQNWSIRYRIPFYEILVKETHKVSKPTPAIVTILGHQP